MNQVLVNILRNFNIAETYVDKDDPRSVNLAAAAFTIISTTNKLKGYSSEKLLFGSDIILLIKHKVDWELICQKNQTQINTYNIHKNLKRVGDKLMLNNKTEYKYETPYNR